jgi:uncharacterized protein (TIGR00255 family)
MKSMTGFGYSEYQDDSIHLLLELKSYNNRYLDLTINMPPFLNQLESGIRTYLSERIFRGKIELYIRVKELKEELTVVLDEQAVKAYTSAMKKLIEICGFREKVSLSHLLSVEGLIKIDKNRDIDYYWNIIHEQLDTAFEEFDSSRKIEGEKTKTHICDLKQTIDNSLKIIGSHTDELEATIQSNIRERFYNLLGDGVDESKVMNETALLLMKYSIQEELTRMHGHLEAFDSELSKENKIGKKLDFLCQELNREANTIGSKSMIMEVNRAVVEIKNAIEDIREQLRNVE